MLLTLNDFISKYYGMLRTLITASLLFIFAMHSLLIGGGKGPVVLNDMFMLCRCEHNDGSFHTMDEFELQNALFQPEIRKDHIEQEPIDEILKTEICSGPGRAHQCPKKVPLKYASVLIAMISVSLAYTRVVLFVPERVCDATLFTSFASRIPSGVFAEVYRPPEHPFLQERS